MQVNSYTNCRRDSTEMARGESIVGSNSRLVCANGNMSFDGWTNPDNATATTIGAIGDSNTWQRSPKERVPRINHGHRLLGGHDQIDSGRELIGCLLICGKEI